jgi:hypothetical protein
MSFSTTNFENQYVLLSGSDAAPTSQIYTAAMLVLLKTENRTFEGGMACSDILTRNRIEFRLIFQRPPGEGGSKRTH